jgi:hypothetical protein
MTARSKDARPWAKRSELRLGDKLVTEAGLFCIPKGAVVEVKGHCNEFYELYVDCAMGKHFLVEISTDDHDSLVHFRRTTE